MLAVERGWDLSCQQADETLHRLRLGGYRAVMFDGCGGCATLSKRKNIF